MLQLNETAYPFPGHYLGSVYPWARRLECRYERISSTFLTSQGKEGLLHLKGNISLRPHPTSFAFFYQPRNIHPMSSPLNQFFRIYTCKIQPPSDDFLRNGEHHRRRSGKPGGTTGPKTREELALIPDTFWDILVISSKLPTRYIVTLTSAL
jgi:hypothetical protein